MAAIVAIDGGSMWPRSSARTEEVDVPAEKIEVENVNVPGRTTRVDAAMYRAARAALLKALPDAPPGLTQAEMIDATKRYLPDDLFPGGAKAGWWVKCVQLDLEAKGLVSRDQRTKPLRWTRGSVAS